MIMMTVIQFLPAPLDYYRQSQKCIMNTEKKNEKNNSLTKIKQRKCILHWNCMPVENIKELMCTISSVPTHGCRTEPYTFTYIEIGKVS
jgi:hypothetical protein